MATLKKDSLDLGGTIQSINTVEQSLSIKMRPYTCGMLITHIGGVGNCVYYVAVKSGLDSISNVAGETTQINGSYDENTQILTLTASGSFNNTTFIGG